MGTGSETTQSSAGTIRYLPKTGVPGFSILPVKEDDTAKGPKIPPTARITNGLLIGLEGQTELGKGDNATKPPKGRVMFISCAKAWGTNKEKIIKINKNFINTVYHEVP